MDSQQFFRYGYTTDSVINYDLTSISNPVFSEWTLNSLKFNLNGSPNSPLSGHSSTGESPSMPVGVHPPDSTQVTSEDIRHALQELETVLMAPDTDEQPMTTSTKTWAHLETLINSQPQARPHKRLKQFPDSCPHNGVKHLLIKCAEAMSDDRIEEFQYLVQEARCVVSIHGDPIQRLGAYMLEGLVARHEESGTNIYKGLKCHEPDSSRELLYCMRILYDMCPYFKFGYMAANGAIAEALRTEDRIHIIDFQIAQGTQWTTLIQALAARPGGPPHVRITGISQGDNLQLVGKILHDMSRKFNIPFEFNPLAVPCEVVTKDMLKIRGGEALAVNFTLQLHHTPDESVDVNNPRDGLLRMVKRLSPKVMTLVEQESNTNTSPFLTRFTETMDYYSAMMESIDDSLARESKERIGVEQHCMGKDIVNMIACEGKERVERHELLGKWRLRLCMAGFKQCPLSSYVNSVIKKLMACYSDKYTLVEKDGALLLGWKGRSLISASAWH
ncbi:chitin-inducible gibberellin-responsive protein 1-like [Dioscorea cayenensis subsp. rotundata]|uniref:Chitin-inducible gibberellin-responsive protein 1-like n=1 Tax=Dioscorea cayennensis subsp. rotundata TaxID=55577 RepID=A0AB40BQY8_DIOCR|nr:chitin-inducible gibberellin-responsive protein 1-like [Dioscorea cayenensis subsp. rotundata]